MKRHVRNAQSGDLGTIITVEGKEFVIYEGRQGQSPIPYRPREWIEETKPRTLTRLQCAEIAFAADQRLLYFLGEHVRAKKPWLSLREEDRKKFSETGPEEPKIRRLVYKSVMLATEPLREGTL